jgi:hypothetical protein
MNCKGCGQDKLEDAFVLRNDRSGRRRPYCNECRNNVERARYENHRRLQPFKLRCSRARARAKFLKVPFDLTPAYLESIWTGQCPVLKCTIHWSTDRKNEYAAELDRHVPSLGYVKGNVTFLARKANRLKNNSSVEELTSLLEWMKQWK